MKRRIITAACLMACLSVLSLLGAYNLDRAAGGHVSECSWNVLTAFTALESRKVFFFFLLFLALSALIVGYMLLSRSYIKYKCDMQQVTPDIRTPKPEGQGQYGTARWLDRRRIPEVFTAVRIDEDDPLIQELCDKGAEDLK